MVSEGIPDWDKVFAEQLKLTSLEGYLDLKALDRSDSGLSGVSAEKEYWNKVKKMKMLEKKMQEEINGLKGVCNGE